MNNLATRTISGAAFAIIIMAGALFSPYLFAALFAFIISALMNEFFNITMKNRFKLARIMTIISGVSLFLLVFAWRQFGIYPALIGLAVIPLMATMISVLFSNERQQVDTFSHLFCAYLYIAAPLSLTNLAVIDGDDFRGVLLICFFLIIWCSDIGAYALGMAFGQKENSKKLCPGISPKKSWIGYWGGLLFAVAAAAILSLTGLMDFGIWHCMALGAVIHIFGVFGDLFESVWKRAYGLKDSGNAIPGHGGFLDRFDSSIMAIPAAVLYLLIFNII